MSVDDKSCSTECKETELLKGKKCIKEEECIGANEIIDRTSD